VRLKRTLTLAASTAVLLALVAVPALALPKTLLGAVQKAYATPHVHIDSLCHEPIGGRSYNLVELTLVKSKRSRIAAFAYRSRTGWFGIWKDGRITRTVPKRQRGRVHYVVKELRRFCGR
jgi:hypothetical protein